VQFALAVVYAQRAGRGATISLYPPPPHHHHHHHLSLTLGGVFVFHLWLAGFVCLVCVSVDDCVCVLCLCVSVCIGMCVSCVSMSLCFCVSTHLFLSRSITLARTLPITHTHTLSLSLSLSLEVKCSKHNHRKSGASDAPSSRWIGSIRTMLRR
jgi:hypothetical protein